MGGMQSSAGAWCQAPTAPINVLAEERDREVVPAWVGQMGLSAGRAAKGFSFLPLLPEDVQVCNTSSSYTFRLE